MSSPDLDDTTAAPDPTVDAAPAPADAPAEAPPSTDDAPSEHADGDHAIDWSTLAERSSEDVEPELEPEPEIDPEEAARLEVEAAQRAFMEAMEAEEAGVRECLLVLRSLPHVAELPPIEVAIQGLRIAAEALREKQAQHPHSTPAEAVRAVDGLADILRADRHLVALYRHLVVLASQQWINLQQLRMLLEQVAALDPTLPKH